MRTIEQTGQFKRDYKREAKSPYRQTLASDFMANVRSVANKIDLRATRKALLQGASRDRRAPLEGMVQKGALP